MIVNFPTGFFDLVLPHTPDNPNSVTYTISNKMPPRAPLNFVNIPVGINQQSHGARQFTHAQRRAILSQRAYSTTQSGGSLAPTNMLQYESGQVLDFEDATISPAPLDPMLVPSAMAVRHDTNILDYAALGLDQATIDAIVDSSEGAYQSLLNNLNDLVSQRSDYEIQLSATQKSINESAKASAGLSAIIELDPSSQVLLAAKQTIDAKYRELSLLQAELTVKANDAAVKAQAMKNKIEQLGHMVR